MKRTQELAAAVYGLLRTQTQHVLEVAGIVFGLTIAFVVPERSITTTELWFLGAAILLLGASIVLGLIVILDAVANVARLQHQSDETTSPENEVKRATIPAWGARVTVLLCVNGIAALTVFALLRLPSAS